MLLRIVRGIAWIVAIALVVLAAGLAMAHRGIRRERAPLPTVAEVIASAGVDDLPVRLSWIDTASQPMPRSAVLDRARDPAAATPYVMSHPSFVLEWVDGRMLLIDTGMDRDGALAFGRPIELLGGADPIQFHASAAATLGADVGRVQGAIFTHLHADHVGGIVELCRKHADPLRVFMTEAQDLRPNYTTRQGRRLLAETPCVKGERLAGATLLPAPGFPGVYVIAAGGHTPGTQIVIAHVRDAAGIVTYAFTGDVVNAADGVTDDVPKPFLYSLLLVPEDGARLAELRGFLRALRDEGGAQLLVSHDQKQLEASGVPLR